MDLLLMVLAALSAMIVSLLWKVQNQKDRADVVKYVRVAFVFACILFVAFVAKFWKYLFIWWLVKS